MSGRQGPSLRTQHVGGAAGPQNTETNLMNWSPQATITAQNLNYQGAESVGPRQQEDAEAAALRGLLLDDTRRNESLLPERLQQSYEPFRAEVGQAAPTLRQQVEAAERLVRQQEAAAAEQAEEAELRRRLQAATEALARGQGRMMSGGQGGGEGPGPTPRREADLWPDHSQAASQEVPRARDGEGGRDNRSVGYGDDRFGHSHRNGHGEGEAGYRTPAGYQMRPLTNAEVTAHKTTLETHEISSWEVRATALFKSKTELAQYVLQCPNTEWDENLSFSKDYLGINRWMGSALVTMMTRGTPRVDALLSRLARTNPEALCDARLILNEIKEETKIQHGQQEQIAIRRFLQFRPLRPGMTIEEVKCAASILQDHHQVLPERGRLRKHDFHYVLIEKMPASTTEMKRKKEELMTLLLEEVSSGSEPPWTVEKLMVKIGVYLSTVRYSGETLECEEAEGSHYDDEANALERRNAAKTGPRSPAGPAASGNTQGSRTPRGCSNCKSTAHKTQDCPKRCPNLACQERSCPGVRDKNLCPVVKDIFPPRSTLLDVYDNPLHSSCLERLKLKHARRKEKEARGEPTECEFADGEDCSIAMLSFDDEGFDSEEESYVAIGESSGDSDAPGDESTFLLDDIESPAEESESESDAIPKMDKDSSGSSDGDSSGGLEGTRPGGCKKKKGEKSKPRPSRNEGWLETTSASGQALSKCGDMNAGGPVASSNSPTTAIDAIVALDADPPTIAIVAIVAIDADPPSTAIVAIDGKGRDPGHNLAEMLQKMVRRRAWNREWQRRMAEPEPQWLQDAAAILVAGASKPAEVLAVEAEEEAEINDAEEGDTEALEAMLDGGSNVNLFTSRKALQHATITTGETRKVTGVFGQKGEGLKPFKLRIELSEAKGDGTMQIDGLFSEKGRRNILSESWLYDRYTARTLKEPIMMIKSPVFEAPIHRRGGHYFVKFDCSTLQGQAIDQILWSAVGARPDGEVNVAGVSRTLTQEQMAHVWAARLGGGERTIRGLVAATQGHGLKQVTAAMVRRAETDTFLRRANQRTKPSVRVDQAARCEPGEVLILDAWGKSQAKSPLDGARYHLSALCARTSEGHHAASRELTAKIWLKFIKWCVAREAALGHRVRVVRLDACPELKEGWLSEIEQSLAHESPPIKVERAAGGHHEGVGLVEQFNGQATRMAEAALARAKMGKAWIIPCRMYQAEMALTLRCRRGATKTRLESHTGCKVDLEKQPPYCFGTKAAYLTDEQKKKKDGKGSLDSSSPVGKIVGAKDGKYQIYTPRGTALWRAPQQVLPLNELELVEAGLPNALEPDEPVGTTSEKQSSDQLPVPEVSARPRRPYTPRDSRVYPAVTGAEHDQPGLLGPPSARTRSSRPQPQEVAMEIREQVGMAESPREAAEAYNAAAYQFGLDEHVESEKELEVALDRLGEICEGEFGEVPADEPSGQPERQQWLGRVPISYEEEPECNKATELYVEVQTDLGPARYTVPATTRAVLEDPHAEEWLAADQRGCDVLTLAGNPLVREKDARAQGHTVIRSVVQRKYKIKHDTKRLAKVDPRKSRVNVDGHQVKMMRQQAGQPSERVGPHAEIADDTLLKVQWSEAAAEDEDMVLADLPTAYTLGGRARPPVYLATPDTCVHEDEEGNRLCWELRTPCYGEEPAGDELEATMIDDLEEAGFEEAEGVSALMTVPLLDGKKGKLTRIVDDFCFTYPRGSDAGHKFVELLKKNYGQGVKVDYMNDARSTGSHAGFALARDRDRKAITIRMPTQVESTVRRFAPEIAEGSLPSKNFPKGVSLQSLCAKMVRPEGAAPAKMSEEQRWVAGVAGGMKFPEKVNPRYSLPVWHLASVMSNPPMPEAKQLGVLLLENAWAHRNDGITYGGLDDGGTATRRAAEVHLVSNEIKLDEPAPVELQATGDANWNTMYRDVYAYVLTRCKGAVAHGLKRMPCVTGSTYEAEGVASVKTAEKVLNVRNIERAFGVLANEATLLGTDSSSNLQVACKQAPGARAKHALRRWHWLRQQISMGRVRLVHVRDADMPADFLTKWLPAKKLEASLERATNSRNAVAV